MGAGMQRLISTLSSAPRVTSGETDAPPAGSALGGEPARLRVLHVLPAFFGGGMERFVAALLRTEDDEEPWSRSQHGFCVLRDADPALLSTLGERTRVWQLGRTGVAPRRDYGCWLRLRRVIREFQPHVVEALSTGTWFDAALATRRPGGAALMLGFHGREDLGAPSWRRRWCNRWAARHAARIFTVSCEARDLLAEDWHLPAEKLCVLPNGLDVGRFLPVDPQSRLRIRESLGIADSGFVGICVANLVPVKMLSVLLKAWSALPPSEGRAHLMLVGSGPLQAQLEALTAKLGCERWVHFLGRREDVPSLLQAADVFVMSSQYEACSMAVLEAMASGLPVVATAAGGIPELVEPGKTGWLVPVQSTQHLTFALRTAIASPETRRRYGLAARAVVEERFSLQACRRRYLDLYRETLSMTPADPAARRKQPVCAE